VAVKASAAGKHSDIAGLYFLRTRGFHHYGLAGPHAGEHAGALDFEVGVTETAENFAQQIDPHAVWSSAGYALNEVETVLA